MTDSIRQADELMDACVRRAQETLNFEISFHNKHVTPREQEAINAGVMAGIGATLTELLTRGLLDRPDQ